MDGRAKDIGFGGGKLLFIGTNIEAGGYGIYRRDGHKWTKIPGSAVRITVDDNGNAYVVNKNDHIFRHDGTRWHLMDGRAKDIGFGGGKLWVIGTNKEGGGYGIYRRDGHKWTKIPGSAARIDVNDDGNAMVTNKYDNIYQYHGTGWWRINGKAKDVGIAKNHLWVIGTNVEGGGRGIYRRD